MSKTEILDGGRREARVRRVRVEVKSGPSRGLQLELDDEPIRIGSAEGCAVRVNDPAVSGMHCELTRTAQGLMLRDLGSTNGTFVDGRRVGVVYVEAPTGVRMGASELKVTPLGTESAIELAADDRWGELLGASVPMRAIAAKLERIAKTDATVLVTGETGTGKELAALGLRDRSARKDGPFVVVDCGAMPANLIESELFGHERGAFTGADRVRAGAFERANGGTIFLDEIGELPLALQPSLLGVLERRQTRRVGGSENISLDVRVVAATNRDLAREVARGAFRADLYYRLAIVEVRLPPLRERVDDIPMLIDHFLSALPGHPPRLSNEVVRQLMAYSWPGNVRELRNVIERAALLAEDPTPGGTAGAAARVQGARAGDASLATTVDVDRPFKDQKNALIDAFERAYVSALMRSTQGNIAGAARKAGIDRMYLYKLLDRLGLDAMGEPRG